MKDKKKIAFIIPPFISSPKLPLRDFPYSEEDLGVGLLASLLRSYGHDVLIIDCALENLNINQTIEKIKSYKPNLIGISIKYLNAHLLGAMKLSKSLKQNGIKVPIVSGGHTATLIYEPILRDTPEIDCVVLGEGEQTLLEVVKQNQENIQWENIRGIAYRIDNQIVKNSPRQLIKDLDSLPFPVRDHIEKTYSYKMKSATMVTSRGCPYNCNFCSVAAFYGKIKGNKKWRGRSPENIVAEVEYLVKNYDVKVIDFPDDNFVGLGKEGENRIFRFVEELSKKNLNITFSLTLRADSIKEEPLKALKSVGLTHIYLGVESGSQCVLNRFNKKITVEKNLLALEIIKKLNLTCNPSYILFDPETTIEEIKETLKFAKSTSWPGMGIKPFNILNSLMPYPGTPIEKKLREQNKLINIPLEIVPGSKESYGFALYEFSDPRVAVVHKLTQMISGVLLRKNLKVSNILKESYEWLEKIKSISIKYNLKGAISPPVSLTTIKLNRWYSNLFEFVINVLEKIIHKVENTKNNPPLENLFKNFISFLYEYEKNLFGTTLEEAIKILKASLDTKHFLFDKNGSLFRLDMDTLLTEKVEDISGIESCTLF